MGRCGWKSSAASYETGDPDVTTPADGLITNDCREARVFEEVRKSIAHATK